MISRRAFLFLSLLSGTARAQLPPNIAEIRKQALDEAIGKVVGSAQVRTARAFLQHGSILLSAEQDVVAGVTTGFAEQPSAAGLDQLVGESLACWHDVAAAVTAAASRRWGVGAAGTLPAATLLTADGLEARYADESWTWRR
jgi:hypothetical protein